MASDPFASISSGELRHPVRIQRRDVIQDEVNGEVISWHDVFLHVWAKVEPLAGRELWAAQQQYPEATTRITVRGAIGRKLDTTMRVLFRESRQYDIVDISDIEERGYKTVLTAIERPMERNI